MVNPGRSSDLLIQTVARTLSYLAFAAIAAAAGFALAMLTL